MTNLSSTVVEFNIKNHSFNELPFTALEINSEDKNKIYWIHSNLDEPDTFRKFAEKLALPEDVIELCQQEDVMPKLIDTDEGLTMQIQCLLSTELNSNNEVSLGSLIIHLTPHFCFTAASGSSPAILELRSSFQKAIRYAKTPCFLLFLILDNIVNDFSKILFNFEMIADQLDLRVRTVEDNIYHEVMNIKQEVMKVKRYVIAVRENLMRISGRNISVISEQCRVSLNNLSNHSHMIVHEADSIRDMLNGLLDQIDNTLIHKMSESMRVLTAFASIFLPLSLITGIYGMNFHWMPELEWKYGYFWALTLILVFGGALLVLFKKNKWI